MVDKPFNFPFKLPQRERLITDWKEAVPSQENIALTFPFKFYFSIPNTLVAHYPQQMCSDSSFFESDSSPDSRGRNRDLDPNPVCNTNMKSESCKNPVNIYISLINVQLLKIFVSERSWLQVRQWTFVFEKLFIRHL